MSKSRSEPSLGTKKRERKNQGDDATNVNPFRTLFPLPAKGIDMRKETARDQADLFKPRPDTVALSATEKHEMRMWGIDVDAVSWPDGTRPPPWVKAVGNTSNKWANKELGIRAAREEQEFVQKLRDTSPFRNKQQRVAGSTPDSPTPPPPWVKELPPVRDGRRQFATGDIIPFLDQHVYPEGGVAEVKRARRREKEAFLKTVFTANDGAAGQRATQTKKAAPAAAAAGASGTSKKRPPRVHRADKETNQDIEGTGVDDAAGGDKPGRAWPYGPACMAAPKQGGEAGGRRRSEESGEDCSARGASFFAADGGADSAVADRAAVCDQVRPVPLEEDGTAASGTDAEVAGSAAAGVGNSSPVDEPGVMADKQGTGRPAEGAGSKRSSGCAGERSDRHPDGRQRPHPEAIGQGNERTSVAADQGTAPPRVATPTPVVTSSVRVLDMGVVRPSE
eukprot:g15941.t1